LLQYAGPATAEIAAVRVQLAVGRHDIEVAGASLEGWTDESEFQAGLLRDLWRAVISDVVGDRSDALDRLEQVVSEAEAEGHIGLFADAGADVQRLLRALFRARPSPYLKVLVRPDGPVPLGASVDGAPGGAVALSTRELVVLRYLPSRLTNAEIADTMFVSLNTVKTYVKSIYVKLAVNTRREAIQRAEELGIV
jgi:LuxR family transcriptional regulator, maltose regulon positive regulatory protein